jgi:two-component system sensor histidine kinase YesM
LVGDRLLKHWLAKSLKRKLSLLVLLAILLPLLLTGIVSYIIATSVSEEKAKQAGENTLRQISDKLEFIIQDVENISIFLIGESDIQQYLDNYNTDMTRFTLNSGMLMNLAYSKKYISNITITPNNKKPELSTTTILHSGLPPLLQQNKDAYRNGSRWWTPLYENQTIEGRKQVFSLVRLIRNTSTFKEMGTLSISLDKEQIATYLTQAGWEKSGFLLLLDNHNHVVSGGDSSWINRSITELFPNINALEGSGVGKYGNGADQKTILYDTIPGINWHLVGFIPSRVFKAQNGYVLTVTAIAVGVALLLAAGLVLIFLQWVTKPLTNLTHYLTNLNPDETIPTYEVKSTDEVGLLVHSYNKLSDRIRRLKEQVQINEAMKKEADILALQAQINPHFLYNTLSSIHWKAQMNKDVQVADMVASLSDFLRFSLNKGEEFCQVQQEISHVQNYVNIQTMRFPEQFDIEFFIDSEMMQFPMLKLLLQPLIENSLIHGIQKKNEKVHVYVHGEMQNGRMRFIVEDTGVGIHDKKLRELRMLLTESQGRKLKQAEKTSYGLLNVHQRLYLHYGNESGITLESEVGVGTRVSFIIPSVEMGEFYENHDCG